MMTHDPHHAIDVPAFRRDSAPECPRPHQPRPLDAHRCSCRRWGAVHLRALIPPLLFLLFGVPAFGATLLVAPDIAPVTRSDGKCSLIEAIENANADASIHSDCAAGNGHDTIRLPRGSVQTLYAVHNWRSGRNGLPMITSAITIEGNESTIARAGNAPAFRLFAVAGTGDLSLDQLTLENGSTHYVQSNGPRARGAAVSNQGGRLALSKVSLVGNHAFGSGGGFFCMEGAATVSDSTFSGNSGHAGGAIATMHSTLVIDAAEFTGNSALWDGGAIWGSHSNVLISHCRFHENAAQFGGAVRHEFDSQVAMLHSLISHNDAAVQGGGLATGDDSTLNLFGCTISDNTTGRGGGAISAFNAALTVSDCTLSGNQSGTEGGGLYLHGLGHTRVVSSTITGNAAWRGGGGSHLAGTLLIADTIVAGNAADVGREFYSCATTCVNAYNIFGAAGKAGVQGFQPGVTDLTPAAPLSAIIDPVLADNGGPTPTHDLPRYSPAADAGNPAFTAPVWAERHDQRGSLFPRVVNQRIDIGALEIQ